MIIFASCVSGDGELYRQVALPTIRVTAGPEDLILELPGEPGICAVYNRFLEVARSEPDCEALVLLHDDVEIIDPDFRSKVLIALRPTDVGLVGVTGASRIPSLAWWESTDRAGLVLETGGALDFGQRQHDVDVVDGLMLAIAPRAFRTLRFDESSFPRFHGYDVDFALQVREAGLRVRTAPIDLFHRTSGTTDPESFARASAAIHAKWQHRLHPIPLTTRVRRRSGPQVSRIRRRLGRLRASLRARRSSPALPTRSSSAPATAGIEDQVTSCVACGASAHSESSTPTSPITILVCENCGTGRTRPAPTRDSVGESIWEEVYGGKRLTNRSIWLNEARQRAEWLQLYLPDGYVVEIGAGTGEFVEVLTDLGFVCSGVEPSEWAANHSRRLGADVTTGVFSDWMTEHRDLRPDAVAMWHVLEHVDQPAELLEELASVIRPGGLLMLEVPNFGSADAKRLGAEWRYSEKIDHFFHYTPEGLTQLLTAAGFLIDGVLEFSSRIYEGHERALSIRNTAISERTPWPTLDLLRIVARTAPADER